jgi:D-amino peptidase
MRIFISVDMEASAASPVGRTSHSGQDYQRARSWMTGDVNAAVEERRRRREEFVVEENHGVEALCNLMLDEIDPRSKSCRPARGGATTMAARRLVRRGVPVASRESAAIRALCAHVSYGEYRDVRLGGRSVGEARSSPPLPRSSAFHRLIAGDDVVAAELRVCRNRDRSL